MLLMEGRMSTKSRRQLSPERAKEQTEKSPKYHYDHRCTQPPALAPAPLNRKVPVVYYLCRNRQLEHPHFMEVPLSSSDGLYLRDVIERLNVLRGRGLASMYSWSCKRSYRNCLVWHDLSADDLIVPAHGNEYVLKGSELFHQPNSGRDGTIMLLNRKALPEPPSCRSQDASSSSPSSSSSLNDRTRKNSQNDEPSSPWNASLSLTEYNVDKSHDGRANASTQTEENGGTSVGGDDGSLDPERDDYSKKQTEIPKDSVSPAPSTSSASSCRKMNTLESLIRADARSFNSFRILEEEEFRIPASVKLKASSMLLQLISCGSVSVKDHSFGLIPMYKPTFSYSRYASPLYSTSSMIGELGPMGVRMQDKEYFSGSFIEMSLFKDGFSTLKRSSSYNADRSAQLCDSTENKKETSSARVNCIPISIKTTLSKESRCESVRSPLSEASRASSDTMGSSRMVTPSSSDAVSKRSTEPLLGQKQGMTLGSFGHEKENVIKIEES